MIAVANSKPCAAMERKKSIAPLGRFILLFSSIPAERLAEILGFSFGARQAGP
jgi:hypothetical protein